MLEVGRKRTGLTHLHCLCKRRCCASRTFTGGVASLQFPAASWEAVAASPSAVSLVWRSGHPCTLGSGAGAGGHTHIRYWHVGCW